MAVCPDCARRWAEIEVAVLEALNSLPADHSLADFDARLRGKGAAVTRQHLCFVVLALSSTLATCGPATARITSEDFQAGEWPLTVDGGTLRCERQTGEASAVVLPIFRPDGSDSEFSFGPWSQSYPDLFGARSDLWAWNHDPMLLDSDGKTIQPDRLYDLHRLGGIHLRSQISVKDLRPPGSFMFSMS